MDNVTHTIVGVLLARAGSSKKTIHGTAAVVIGANLPDVDVLWCTNHTDYLAFHRGITHAPAAILALVLGVACGLVLVRRWWPFAREIAVSPWCAFLLLGLASHVVLDGLNSYGVRPFLPFASRWLHGDLLFIVDPWVWGLGLAFLIALAREREWRLTCLGSACALTFTVWAARNDRSSIWVPAALAGLLLVGVVMRRALRQVRAPTVAMSALLTLALYLAGAATMRALVATTFMREYPQWTAVARDIALLPSAADPTVWRIVVDDGTSYQSGRMRAVGDRHMHDVLVIAKNLDRPDITPLLQTREGRAVMAFMRFPFARIVNGEVFLLDARYRASGTDGFGVYSIGHQRDVDFRAAPFTGHD